MVKKISFLMMATLLGIAVNAQTWVNFGRSEPIAPEVSVLNSTNLSVVFSVNVYGMFTEVKTEGNQTYQRISLPECGVTGEIGSPELPVVLSQLIAVPECDNIVCTVNITSSQTLTNYLVYPVPDRNTDGEEIFVLDGAVYGQNVVMPAADYQVSDNGYLRSQRYTQLTLNPMRYNPATQTLTVATAMEVTLTFVNPSSDVNANLGIFANVA